MSREQLMALLGDRPSANPAIHQFLGVETIDTFIVEHLLLDLNGEERVPTYFIKPKDQHGPFPVVLFHHSHDGNYTVGRKEVLQSAWNMQPVSFAKELTDLGYAVLAIDAWGFDERSGKKEGNIFKEMLLKGQVLWGMMLYDNLHAIDYVSSRDDVDSSRIGNIGFSMGGMTAWWLAALDERIKVTVDIGGQVHLETVIEQQLLDKHNLYFYVPSLLKYFTTSDIQALIAPRKRLSLVGRNDLNCPIQGVQILARDLKEVYKKADVPTHFKQVVTTGGHLETTHMRFEWKQFLKENL